MKRAAAFTLLALWLLASCSGGAKGPASSSQSKTGDATAPAGSADASAGPETAPSESSSEGDPEIIMHVIKTVLN